MIKLCPKEVDLRTYHLGVNKTILFSSSIVIFRVKNIQSHVFGPLYYCSYHLFLSNILSTNPNGDHMEKLWPHKFDVQTYHFGVQKTIVISSYRVIFMVYGSEINRLGHFYYFSP